MDTSSRRKLLAALSTGLAATVAGCSDGGSGTTTTTTEATTTTTDEATTTTTTTESTTTTETTTTTESTTTTTTTTQNVSLDGTYPTHMATAGRTGSVDVPGPKRGVGKVWEALVDSQNRGPYAPVLVDGRLYAVAGSKVGRYNPANGDEDWDHEFESPVFAGPTVSGGTVYVPTQIGLNAVDAASGEREWRAKQVRTYTGQVGPPVVVEDTVYVLASDSLFAVDAEEGTTNWSTSAGRGPVALGAGMAFAGNSGGVTGISLAEESTAWSTRLPGSQTTTPRTADGRVFVQAKPVQATPKVYCFDASGEEQWSHTLRGDGLQDAKITALGVGVGQVFVGTDSGTMHSLAPEDGSQNWRNDLRQGRYYQPTIADGVVYATNVVDNLIAIDAGSGELLFQSGIPNNSLTPPVVNGEDVYLANKTYMYALTQ